MVVKVEYFEVQDCEVESAVAVFLNGEVNFSFHAFLRFLIGIFFFFSGYQQGQLLLHALNIIILLYNINLIFQVTVPAEDHEVDSTSGPVAEPVVDPVAANHAGK